MGTAKRPPIFLITEGISPIKRLSPDPKPNANPLDRVIEWIPLYQVPAVIEILTGYKPSAVTIYNWAKAGKLRVHPYKPMRTTKRWIMDFLETRKALK